MEEERKVVDDVEQVHDGCKLRFHIWDNDSAVEEVLGPEDCYQIHELFDRRFGVPCRAAVIDFGANVGAFTIAMLMRGCSVLSVEADWQTHTLLVKNVADNMGVLHGPEHFSPVNAMVGGVEPLHSFHWKGPRSFVPPMKVDARLWDIFDVDYPRVIKLDIEGWEQQLFNRPEATGLFAMAHLILMEWHCYDGERYKDFLEKLGFKVNLTGCGNPAPRYNPSFARGMLYAIK